MAFSLSVRALRRLPKKVVHDTKPFANCLAYWHPLVLARSVKNTPRTARRFQNRVRYLAMRQRAMLDGRPLPVGERLLRYLFSRGKASDVETDKAQSFLAVLPSKELSGEENFEIEQVSKLLERGSGKTDRWEVSSGNSGVTLRPIGTVSVTAEEFKAWVTGDIYIPEALLVALAAIHEYEEDWIEDAVLFDSTVASETRGTEDGRFGDRLALVREAQSLANWQWRNLKHYRRAYLRLCSEISKDDITNAHNEAHAAAGS